MSTADSEVLEKNISHMKVDISGMTCEIGCARLIQSNLYKAEGIEFAKVSFEDSTGVLTYDANRISPEEIQKVIEGAGGGDLYTVKEMQAIEELPTLEWAFRKGSDLGFLMLQICFKLTFNGLKRAISLLQWDLVNYCCKLEPIIKPY